jgi:hypothetical protein
LDPPAQRVSKFLLAPVFCGSRDRASPRFATSMFLLLCRFFSVPNETRNVVLKSG